MSSTFNFLNISFNIQCYPQGMRLILTFMVPSFHASFSSNGYVKIIFPAVLQPSNGIRKRVIGRSLKFHPLMGSPVKKLTFFWTSSILRFPPSPPPILNRVYSTWLFQQFSIKCKICQKMTSPPWLCLVRLGLVRSSYLTGLILVLTWLIHLGRIWSWLIELYQAT